MDDNAEMKIEVYGFEISKEELAEEGTKMTVDELKREIASLL